MPEFVLSYFKRNIPKSKKLQCNTTFFFHLAQVWVRKYELCHNMKSNDEFLNIFTKFLALASFSVVNKLSHC